jgi:hypothetical protein
MLGSALISGATRRGLQFIVGQVAFVAARVACIEGAAPYTQPTKAITTIPEMEKVGEGGAPISATTGARSGGTAG